MLRPPRACQPGLALLRGLALGTPLRQWPPAASDVSDDVCGPPSSRSQFYYYRDVSYPSRHFVFGARLRCSLLAGPLSDLSGRTRRRRRRTGTTGHDVAVVNVPESRDSDRSFSLSPFPPVFERIYGFLVPTSVCLCFSRSRRLR